MKNGCQKILNLNVVTKFVCVCACVRACVRMFKCVCVCVGDYKKNRSYSYDNDPLSPCHTENQSDE